MLTTLTEALSEGCRHGRDDCTWKEVGYRPVDRQAPDAVLRARQPALEHGGMILTGNQSFGSWGDDFRDRVMAGAIRDRVVASRGRDRAAGVIRIG
jgi:hypothetical protein